MNLEVVKICPACEAEYIPTVERCPTCGGELLMRAADEAAEARFAASASRDGQLPRLDESEPALRLAVYRLDTATGLAVELAANGIAYRMEPWTEEPEPKDERAPELAPPKPKKLALDSPDQLFAVLVHPRDQERAVEALVRFQSQEAPDQPAEGDEELSECPACGAALVAFELGKRCPDCELEFHQLPEQD